MGGKCWRDSCVNQDELLKHIIGESTRNANANRCFLTTCSQKVFLHIGRVLRKKQRSIFSKEKQCFFLSFFLSYFG